MINLDYEAAKFSQELIENATRTGVGAKDLENVVTKTLGILQSNGVYAGFLFAQSRIDGKKGDDQASTEDKACVQMIRFSIELLNATSMLNPDFPDQQYQVPVLNNRGNVVRHKNQTLRGISQQLCTDVHQNHLAYTVLERYLTYARYHAKGLG